MSTDPVCGMKADDDSEANPLGWSGVGRGGGSGSVMGGGGKTPYAAQGNSQADDEIAENGRFRTRTG